MDNQKQGEKLSQFARFLFDEAAHNFYVSIGIEILVGLLSVVVNFLQINEEWKFCFAIIGFLLFAYSYYLRIKFDNQYDTADTMRRQSVLSEALDWPVSTVQFSEWKLRSSKATLKRIQIENRSEDYYATKSGFGSKKLLEMTAESAFYTRSLYGKLSTLVIFLLICSSTAIFLTFTLLPFSFIPSHISLRIAYIIYLLLPIILSIDLLSWAFKLSRLRASIKDIESDIERTLGDKKIDDKQAMRLVSEYNCQVASGFPIHNWLFKIWHDGIREIWESK